MTAQIVDEALAFVDLVAHPAIVPHLDLGAMHMNGDFAPLPARLPALAPVLSHVHVSEPHLAPAPADPAPLMPVLFPAFAGDLFVLPGLKDGVLLVVLSLACTLLPFALSLVALKHLSAYGVQLVTNLEPVYAIVLAIVLLGEQRELTPLFYLGVGIILAAVFLHPLTQRPKRIEHPEVLGTSEAKNIVE